MGKLFNLLWHFIKEKVSVFLKGFVGGTVFSGIFLFNSRFGSGIDFWTAYGIRLAAALITGVLSGFTSVLGNDIYHYIKKKVTKKKKEETTTFSKNGKSEKRA